MCCYLDYNICILSMCYNLVYYDRILINIKFISYLDLIRNLHYFQNNNLYIICLDILFNIGYFLKLFLVQY